MTGSWIVAKSPRTVHLILEKALYLFLVPSHHSISVFLSLCQFSNILFLIMKCRSYLKVIPSSSCLTARSSPLYICARAHTHTFSPSVTYLPDIWPEACCDLHFRQFARHITWRADVPGSDRHRGPHTCTLNGVVCTQLFICFIFI